MTRHQAYRQGRQRLRDRRATVKKPDNDELFDADRLYGTYTEAQWRTIEKSLADVGVDLDAEVTDLGPSVLTEGERSLRGALQVLAWYFGAASRLRRAPMPKQQAADLRKGLAAFEAARDALPVAYYVDHDLTVDQLRDRAAANHAVNSALADLIARLERRLDTLAAMGSSSRKNARRNGSRAT